jgi:hypothetical protein
MANKMFTYKNWIVINNTVVFPNGMTVLCHSKKDAKKLIDEAIRKGIKQCSK